MFIFSIDVGIVNMGVAFVHCKSLQEIEVIFADRVDITQFKCKACCPLHHSRVMSDWISHFLVRFKTHIERSEIVLIERQPPLGHTCVEQLIFHACREKAVLIHPRSLHAFFCVGSMKYDDRKKCLTNKARSIFKNSEYAQWVLSRDDRVHDVSDALLFVVYYINQTEPRRQLSSSSRSTYSKKKTDIDASNISNMFAEFTYKKHNGKNMEDRIRQ